MILLAEEELMNLDSHIIDTGKGGSDLQHLLTFNIRGNISLFFFFLISIKACMFLCDAEQYGMTNVKTCIK